MTVEDIKAERDKALAIEGAIHDAAIKIREAIEAAEKLIDKAGGDSSEVEERILELVQG